MKQFAAEDTERSIAIRGLCGLADIQCTEIHQAVPQKLQVHQFDSNDTGDSYE